MFSNTVSVGLVEEMSFQPSFELLSTDECWAEMKRKTVPDSWCC